MKLLKSLTGKIMIEGHRGAEGLAAENSWNAIEAGYAAGADLLELDIQRTKDGKLILHHNYQLADGRWLREVTYTEMCSTLPEDRHPALLVDVLGWAKSRAAGLSLDIKNGFGFDFQIFIDSLIQVERFNLIDNVLFVGWDHEALLKLKRLNPAVMTRGLIRGMPVDVAGLAIRARLDALNLDADMATPRFMNQLHGEGIAVTIAELFNPDYARAIKLEADIICCKDPASVHTAIKNYSG